MEEAPESTPRLCALSERFREHFWIPASLICGHCVPNARIDQAQACLLRTMFKNLREPDLEKYEALLSDAKDFQDKPYANRLGLQTVIEIVYDFLTVRKAAAVIVGAVQAYMSTKSSLTTL